MRIIWEIRSIAIGFVIMLVIYYVFSLALSDASREDRMIYRLANLEDNGYEIYRGTDDRIMAALISSWIALFFGGMAAVFFGDPGRAARAKSLTDLLSPSIVTAIVPLILMIGAVLITWQNSVNMWEHSTVDQYGRPFEPLTFPFVLILTIFMSLATLITSMAGGLTGNWLKSAGQRIGFRQK